MGLPRGLARPSRSSGIQSPGIYPSLYNLCRPSLFFRLFTDGADTVSSSRVFHIFTIRSVLDRLEHGFSSASESGLGYDHSGYTFQIYRINLSGSLLLCLHLHALCICMQICSVNCQFYLLALLATTFVFIFPFLRAAVRAVSLVHHVPLFFFSLLCCMVCYGTNNDR